MEDIIKGIKITCRAHSDGSYEQGVMTMAGAVLAARMASESKDAVETMIKRIRSMYGIQALQTGFVLFFESMEKDECPACIDFLDKWEKSAILKEAIDRAIKTETVSDMTFAVIAKIANDLASFQIVDRLLKVFLIRHLKNGDPKTVTREFMRMFAFLKGEKVYVYFFRYVNDYLKGMSVMPSSSDLARMLCLMRKVKVANFKEIWQESLKNEIMRHVIHANCVVRGARRIAKRLWPALRENFGAVMFSYCNWYGEFGDFSKIVHASRYRTPDSSCVLLAHAGNMAIVRLNGKRRLMMVRNGHVMILPCKSKNRDAEMILASLAV
jgi:hypothetical protein